MFLKFLKGGPLLINSMSISYEQLQCSTGRLGNTPLRYIKLLSSGYNFKITTATFNII